MGLHPGKGVSEIGQLLLEDFFQEDGMPCFRTTAAGEGQSQKKDASEVVVTVHPRPLVFGL